ncbi:MAG: hypothetical protein RIR55_297 [Bacteroidota bacterium]
MINKYFRFFMFFSVFILFSNCQKESTNVKIEENDKLEFNVSSDGRMLIFKTSKDYKKIIEDTTSRLRSKFFETVKNMKHTTYSEYLGLTKNNEDDSLIGDEELAQILNEDWIVQIGDYLYRVNKPTESVYVLASSQIDDYQDLVNENMSNKNIRKFSTSDGVIELAENGDEGQKGLFCNEDNLADLYDDVPVFIIPGFGEVYQFWGDCDYRKYGIYFTIVTRARSSVIGQIRIYIQLENVWHHQSCGSTAGPYSVPWYQSNPPTDNFQKHRSYSGSIPLNGLHTKFRIRCEVPNVPQGGNSYSTYFTEWGRIQGNNPYFP